MTTTTTSSWSRRRGFVLAVFAALAMTLVVRAVYIQLIDDDFYKKEGRDRQIRTVEISASRGDLLDRHGDPIAISTPIPSLYGDPDKLIESPGLIQDVAGLLSVDANRLQERISLAAERGRSFVYIQRHVCLLYTSPSPRDRQKSRMPSSA